MSSSGPQDRDTPLDIDPTVPHTARVWNYWLGGKDHYPVDREAGNKFLELMPGLATGARAVRGFLFRAVRYLAGEAGIRQFLDVGTGLPTANNTHEVAQATAPDSRIVYVDNDPLVLAHARALLTSTREGRTAYIDANACDPDRILREAARTLDFNQPVALMLLGILNHIIDDDEAHAIVNRLMSELPPGSFLVLSHPTAEVDGKAMLEGMRIWNESGGTPPLVARSRLELVRFFDGLDLLEPGVVSVSRWQPGSKQVGSTKEVFEFCGVGRKPGNIS